MDERRDGGPVVSRVPEDVLVGMKVKLLEEDVADAVLDEEARAGEAHLARVVVLAGRLARGRVDVGVLEHDEGVLAAELAGERNDVAGRRDADVTRRLGRAGKRDTTDQRVGDERGARLLADPLNDVEDAGRQPRLGDEVGEQRARERRPLRRLEHDRAAGSQGRGRLPGRKHEGGVPRCDHRDRPRGHPLHAVPGAVGAPVPLLVGGGKVGVGPVVPRSTGDDAGPERAQQHRHVLALDGSEALDVRVDQVGRAVSGSRRGPPGRAPTRRGRRRARRGRRGRPPPAPPATPRRAARSSIGELSSKRSADATRSPPMKWSVETETPATSTRLSCRRARRAHSSLTVARSSTV